MLRRALLSVLFLVLCAASGFAQPSKPDNTLPMFGGVTRGECFLEADKKLIEDVTKQFGSREKAAEKAVQLGWQYYYRGDGNTAMKRFNQAWLLAPENPDAFWGFGVVMGSRGKFDESIKLFERARALAPKKPRMLVDYAFSLIWKGNNGSKSRPERDAAFANAHELLNEAERMEPGYPLVYANRAILCYFQGDYATAWRNVERAQALEPRAVQENFVRDLSSRMPRPSK
ncbi:MAG: hypothetical protein KKF77_10930 [Proteobacteria bacterium]|nr:hypothetical protein [Pseudomonadota bacterium]